MPLPFSNFAVFFSTPSHSFARSKTPPPLPKGSSFAGLWGDLPYTFGEQSLLPCPLYPPLPSSDRSRSSQHCDVLGPWTRVLALRPQRTAKLLWRLRRAEPQQRQARHQDASAFSGQNRQETETPSTSLNTSRPLLAVRVEPHQLDHIFKVSEFPDASGLSVAG